MYRSLPSGGRNIIRVGGSFPRKNAAMEILEEWVNGAKFEEGSAKKH